MRRASLTTSYSFSLFPRLLEFQRLVMKTRSPRLIPALLALVAIAHAAEPQIDTLKVMDSIANYYGTMVLTIANKVSMATPIASPFSSGTSASKRSVEPIQTTAIFPPVRPDSVDNSTGTKSSGTTDADGKHLASRNYCNGGTPGVDAPAVCAITKAQVYDLYKLQCSILPKEARPTWCARRKRDGGVDEDHPCVLEHTDVNGVMHCVSEKEMCNVAEVAGVYKPLWCEG